MTAYVAPIPKKNAPILKRRSSEKRKSESFFPVKNEITDDTHEGEQGT